MRSATGRSAGATPDAGRQLRLEPRARRRVARQVARHHVDVAPRRSAGGDQKPGERLLARDAPAAQLRHHDRHGALRVHAVRGREQVRTGPAVALGELERCDGLARVVEQQASVGATGILHDRHRRGG